MLARPAARPPRRAGPRPGRLGQRGRAAQQVGRRARPAAPRPGPARTTRSPRPGRRPAAAVSPSMVQAAAATSRARAARPAPPPAGPAPWPRPGGRAAGPASPGGPRTRPRTRVAAAPVELDGRPDGGRGLVPVGARRRPGTPTRTPPTAAGTDRPAAQQRLQLVEHLGQLAGLAEDEVGGLEPVQARGQGALVAGRAPGRHRPPAVVDRLGEMQSVRREDGEPGQHVRLAGPVAQRLGDAQPASQVGDAVADRHARARPGRRRRARAARASPAGGRRPRGRRSRPAGRPARRRGAPAASSARPRATSARADTSASAPARRRPALRVQRVGVAGREPAHGLLAGQQPGAGRPRPVARRGGVPGHRLRPAASRSAARRWWATRVGSGVLAYSTSRIRSLANS